MKPARFGRMYDWFVDAAPYLDLRPLRALIAVVNECGPRDHTMATRAQLSRRALLATNHMGTALRRLADLGLVELGEDGTITLPGLRDPDWVFNPPTAGRFDTDATLPRRDENVPRWDGDHPTAGDQPSHGGTKTSHGGTVESVAETVQPRTRASGGALAGRGEKDERKTEKREALSSDSQPSPTTSALATISQPEVHVQGELVPALAAAPKAKPVKKAARPAPPPEDPCDALRLFLKWQTRTGMTTSDFKKWKKLITDRIALYKLPACEDVVEMCTTEPFWIGAHDDTRDDPPCRDIEAVFRHERFKGQLEKWRQKKLDTASSGAALVPAAATAARVYVPNEGEARAHVDTWVLECRRKRGLPRDPVRPYEHDHQPPSAEDITQQRLPVGMLPVGSGVTDGTTDPWWVWERGPATDMVTQAWGEFVATRYAVKRLLAKFPHPEIRSVAQQILAKARLDFDRAVDAVRASREVAA